MFVIEDDNNEMFGFYFIKQIPLNENYIETDDKSFYFILNSKRNPSPMKFNLQYFPYGIHLFSKHSDKLIRLGDILLFKEDFKEKSLCRRNVDKCYGDYNGIDDALCGKSGSKRSGMNFIPKRILVIQMG